VAEEVHGKMLSWLVPGLVNDQDFSEVVSYRHRCGRDGSRQAD